jgi:hypothetical protein
MFQHRRQSYEHHKMRGLLYTLSSFTINGDTGEERYYIDDQEWNDFHDANWHYIHDRDNFNDAERHHPNYSCYNP